MKTDYKKRQRNAGIVSVLVWLVLAACTRLWGCACEETPRPAVEGVGAGIDHGMEGPIPTTVDSGIREDGGVEFPCDAGMLSSYNLEDLDASGTEYILLLGFDRSGKLPGRTDSMMIVAARYDTKDIGVISLPRDLWVDIPGAQPGRINKVFRVGNILSGPGGGYKLIKKVIRQELGVKIDYVAAVDFAGFSNIIDLFDGIYVNVRCPIKDNFVSTRSKTGYEPLSIEAGKQRMSGHTALLFSRSRHGRSDMDRARRQQAVLLGLKNRAVRVGTIFKLPALWKEFQKNVATDIDLTATFRLAYLARTADMNSIHGLVLREPVVYEWRSPEGKSAVILNRVEFAKAFSRLFEAPPPGEKKNDVCRPPDVAFKWKELAQKRKEHNREKAETRKTTHASTDAGPASSSSFQASTPAAVTGPPPPPGKPAPRHTLSTLASRTAP